MSKAVPPSQQPSSPGLSEADRVSPSTAPERHLADPCVPAPAEAVSDNRPLAVPRTDSGEWTSQFDSFLCQALCSGALNEREAIAAIRATNPGWSREFVWQHVRLLRPETPQQVPRDRYAFSEAEDAFLKESYGKDRRSTRRAIDAILARHPEWPRRAVIERGRQLGLSRKNQHRVARWSEGEMIQLLNLQEKPVRYLEDVESPAGLDSGEAKADEQDRRLLWRLQNQGSDGLDDGDGRDHRAMGGTWLASAGLRPDHREIG